MARRGGRAVATALAGLLLGPVVLAGLAGCRDDADPDAAPTASSNPSSAPSGAPTTTAPPPPAPTLPSTGRAPNIVLVLMDDFSMDLLPSMGTATTMAETGASYPHSFVVDSLCCVSRSVLMTGQYPHQNGVRTNTSTVRDERGPLGGWPAFEANGNPQRSVSVSLQAAGYRTGFVGKYLNEYEYNPGWALPPRPPGWDQFHAVFGSAYDGWGFDVSRVGAEGQWGVTHHPTPARQAPARVRDAAYQGQVVEDLALDFIRTQQKTSDAAPYFLQIAPYGPHSRTDAQGAWPDEPFFPAAFRDRPTADRPGNCGPVTCASLSAADLPGFGDDPADNRPVRRDGSPARAWNVDVPVDPEPVLTQMRRQRAQMAQSIDRTLARVLALVDDNTYVVLTSDNGFHLGQQGLGQGKGTPYDTDVRVPLLVVGPGVAPGERSEWASTLDLTATLEDLAGRRPTRYRAGHSLVPSLADAGHRSRSHVFFEHTSEPGSAGDPDRVRNGYENDRIPSYVAVRGDEGLLVRHDLRIGAGPPQYGFEFYAYDEVGFEQRNQFTDPEHRAAVQALLRQLRRFDSCADLRAEDHVPQRCR